MTPDELRAVYPEATILGSTALHRAGWTTQIPASIHVAVLDTRMPVEVDLYDIVGRPASWFGRATDSLWELPSLSPIAALVDAWTHDDQWRPQPDDLEDDTPWETLRAAFAEAGVPWPVIYANWRPQDFTGGRRIRADLKDYERRLDARYPRPVDSVTDADLTTEEGIEAEAVAACKTPPDRR